MGAVSFYSKVVKVTAIYLGPVADRFISLLVVGHLDKAPGKLSADDISDLLEWIKPAAALILDDTKAVDRYIARLQKLAEAKPKHG